MIWYQGQTNSVTLTLSESLNITADTPYFLFKITSPTSKQSVYFTAQNLSTNQSLYDRFNITLTGTSAHQNLTAGTIYIQPNGKWDFEVYQMSSQTNLDITQVVGGPIEIGWVKISGVTNQNIITNQYTGTGGTGYYTYYQPSSF